MKTPRLLIALLGCALCSIGLFGCDKTHEATSTSSAPATQTAKANGGSAPGAPKPKYSPNGLSPQERADKHGD